MDHDQLVARGVTWLRGSGHCPLVLAGMASCSEIPDAIGFATGRTLVIECKTSVSDFRADRAKYTRLVRNDGASCSLKAHSKHRKMFDGCPEVAVPNMGSQRYYLCEPDVITVEMVKARHPDHGLLHIHGRKIITALSAPPRPPAERDLDSEVRYLQFAMRHLLDNLGSAGIAVDVLRATKMSAHGSITLHPWKKEHFATAARLELMEADG